MTWSTEAKTRAAFLTAAVIVILLGVLAYQNTANVADSTEQRYQAYDILQVQDAAWKAWNEAVVAQLGYVTSGGEAYLEQYTLARKATVENMTQLLRLQFENASQIDQSVRLVPLVAASLSLADCAILLKRVGLDSLAAGIGFTAISSSLLDANHRTFDALQVETRQNATSLTVEYDLGSLYAIILTIVRTVLMLGILAFSYYFIQRDLVGRRRFEHLLREERSLLRTVIDVLPINIYVKDADLRFVLMNRSQAKLVGAASPESAIGKRDADFFPTEWVAQYVADERAILETGQPLIGREEPSISPDGDQLVMLTTKVPVRDASGSVTQIVGVSQDITARKAAEREIEDLNETLRQHATQLERANQEMEAFSYSISHDLRAPLRAIDGFSRIILRDYSADVPDEGRRYLEKVRYNAQRMSSLLDGLIQFVRVTQQAIHRERIEPAALVQRILDEEFRSVIQAKSIHVEIGTLPACNADPLLLRQVYANLLSNAIKFTSKRDHATIEVGAKRENGSVVYYVRDNGVGFDNRYVDKLFGIFERLHRQEDFVGVGAGLAIVYRAITRHGGRVWAEGIVDQGATFYFTLGDTHE